MKSTRPGTDDWLSAHNPPKPDRTSAEIAEDYILPKPASEPKWLTDAIAETNANIRAAFAGDHQRFKASIAATDGWQLVPKMITPEMAQRLESNFAECLPPSEVHQANWRDAYTEMLAAAPVPPAVAAPLPAKDAVGEAVAWRIYVNDNGRNVYVYTEKLPYEPFTDSGIVVRGEPEALGILAPSSPPKDTPPETQAKAGPDITREQVRIALAVYHSPPKTGAYYAEARMRYAIEAALDAARKP